MSIIQQLEDLKEWSQDSTRYERRLAFRNQSMPGGLGTEAGTIPLEFDELSDREIEYYRTGPWSTREDYSKGQLVQPGPGRPGYKGNKPDSIDADKSKWFKEKHFNNPDSDFYKVKWEDLNETVDGTYKDNRGSLTRRYNNYLMEKPTLTKIEKGGWTQLTDFSKTNDISEWKIQEIFYELQSAFLPYLED